MEKRRLGTCVGDIQFEAAHYTPVNGEPTLHGHTFNVSVCVYGTPQRVSGWVMDFDLLRRIVNEIIAKYNYALIAPASDKGKLNIMGPFKTKITYIEAGQATAENLGREICSELVSKINELGIDIDEVEVIIHEGLHNSSVTCCSPPR